MGRSFGLAEILLTVSVIIVAAVLALLGFLALDHFNAPTKVGTGSVTVKNYYLPYTTFVLAGKVFVPVYHAERWEICLAIKEELKSGCLTIRENDWERIQQGDQFTVTYSLGNLSANAHLYKIE